MTTRDTILDAAASVMREQGLAKTTTKEIARAAGFSEATLYKHFQDKEELFVEVLRARLPSFVPLVKSLNDTAGQGTVRDNLLAAARAAVAFYYSGFPMNASIFSEPQLLARHRDTLAKRNMGPHRAVDGLAGYLEKEQQLGRVAAEVAASAAAALLLGACFQHAFLLHFAGRDLDPAEQETFATDAVDTLLRAL
jgi:AcrR family transcriptional regulator